VSRAAVVAVLVVAAVTWLTGCGERRRTAVIEHLVTDVAVPDYRELSARADRLAQAADQLATAPAAAQLAAAQAAWRDAIVGWKQTFVFRQGEIVKQAPHFHAAYWPPEPRFIARALAAGGPPIDDAFVSGLGISAKGMFVIERLLFGAPSEPEDPLAAVVAPAAERRRALLRALARDVASRARDAAALVAAPAAREAVTRAGQQTVNQLVNDAAGLAEDVVTARLGLVVGAAENGTLASNPVEGGPSGSSQAITLALVRGVARLYGGDAGGLSVLVRAVSRPADDATRAAIAHAIDSVTAIGGPLENVVVVDRERVARAAADVRALEVALKTQVASALGVTLTFTAGDGD